MPGAIAALTLTDEERAKIGERMTQEEFAEWQRSCLVQLMEGFANSDAAAAADAARKDALAAVRADFPSVFTDGTS